MKNPSGNLYDKEGTRNPLARSLINRFYNTLNEFIIRLDVKMCLEVGCGEGWIVSRIKKANEGLLVYGCDLSNEIIKIASRNNKDVNFLVASIYQLPFKTDTFDLVVACEVLEHLCCPYDAIKEIKRVSNSFCLFSVPHEPLWCFLNILRGKYISRFGNTIGHIQHWTKKSFLEMLERDFVVLKVRLPIPWIMVLCKIK
jgi:ubiquinone/menaquinone biosynthesis C-methylase UbiE